MATKILLVGGIVSVLPQLLADGRRFGRPVGSYNIINSTSRSQITDIKN
jgi:hypothetical protein